MSPLVARSERDHAASLGRVALHFPSVVQGGGSGLKWPHPISLASPREAAVASCPPTSRRRRSKTAASPGGYASFPLRRRGKGQRPRRPGTISREGSGSGLMSPSIARTGRGHGCFPRRCLRVSRRGLFSASGDARQKSHERAQRRRTTTTKPCVSAGVDAEPATTAVPSDRPRAGEAEALAEAISGGCAGTGGPCLARTERCWGWGGAPSWFSRAHRRTAFVFVSEHFGGRPHEFAAILDPLSLFAKESN